MLKILDQIIAKPWAVTVLIMVLSIGAHMAVWGLTKSSYDAMPLEGRAHDIAVVLLDSGGTALWTPNNTPDYQKLSFVPPVFPLFVTATYLLFGRSWAAIALTQAVVSGLLSILLYSVGRLLFSYRVGFLAGMWALFYPYLFSQGGPNLSYETILFTGLLLASVVVLLGLQRNSSVSGAALAGLCLGMAALCRPDAFISLPFVFAWLIKVLSGSWQRRIRLAMVLLAIFLAPIGAWTLRNWTVDGISSPFGSYSTQNIYKAYHPMLLAYYQGAGPFADPQLRSLSSDRVFEQGPLWDTAQTQGMTAEEAQTWRCSMPWSYWRRHPNQFVQLTILKVTNLWSWILEPRTLSWRKQAVYAISYVPVLFLGIAGFWLRRDRWSSTSLFLALFLSFTVFAAISYGVSRYRVPLDVYLILMASASIEFIVTHLSLKVQSLVNGYDHRD